MKKIPTDLTTDMVDITIALTFIDGIIGKAIIPLDALDEEMLQVPLGAYIRELLNKDRDMYKPWDEAFGEAEEEDMYYGGLQ